MFSGSIAVVTLVTIERHRKRFAPWSRGVSIRVMLIQLISRPQFVPGKFLAELVTLQDPQSA